jgi:hypothetical protein
MAAPDNSPKLDAHCASGSQLAKFLNIVQEYHEKRLFGHLRTAFLNPQTPFLAGRNGKVRKWGRFYFPKLRNAINRAIPFTSLANSLV